MRVQVESLSVDVQIVYNELRYVTAIPHISNFCDLIVEEINIYYKFVWPIFSLIFFRIYLN